MNAARFSSIVRARLSRLGLTAGMGLALLVGLGGCVPQSKYDDLMTGYRSKEQQVLTLQGDLDSSRANEEALRVQLAQAAESLRAARDMMAGGDGSLDEMTRRYEDLLKRINDMEAGPLAQSVSDALTIIANQYPDLLEFDAKRGMLRFKSDVTFDSGQARLSSKASEVLRKIAPVLNTGEAMNLEVKVVGHTDNQPIVRVKAEHPTNVHLSAHRAISVRDELVRSGVQAARFQVAGYGEFRPLVANGSKGARENRRVEIFLTPLSINLSDVPSGGEVTADSAPSTITAPRRTNQPVRRAEEPSK
ncbi:MAG: OmpA family protein [Phycisphaerae bacterium]|nr:OmpA family protein [Phycisphaerae bacterium]